jgi:hypothetical protein
MYKPVGYERNLRIENDVTKRASSIVKQQQWREQYDGHKNDART